MKQAIAHRESLLGALHPRTLDSRSVLVQAHLLAERGREAVEEGQQLLIDCVKVLVHRHPDTIRPQALLANIFFRTRRKADAVRLLEQAIDLALGLDFVLPTLENWQGILPGWRAEGEGG